uniref:CCHC-type domain-containing protein n=1 Tax=Tanacetum cinerariifolium TaxID=118510 RepID=A0A6L2J2I0_TANCI|nr:hypothetical protein [Tanacetum cinerariifolium]
MAKEQKGKGKSRAGRLLHHEVEGQVDKLVEEVEELENQQAELVVERVIKQLQDLLPTIIAKVENHASNIQGDIRSANVGNGRIGGSYKEFMACNLKYYDGKGGAIVCTHWIEKIDSVQDMSGCGANQKVKYTPDLFIGKEFCPNNELQKLETKFWCHAIVGAGHAAYIDRFHELARLVPHLVTLENKSIERNGSLRKNTEKRGNRGELSRNENVRDDNKRSRIGRAFVTVTNPVGKEYTGTTPKYTNCSFHHNLEMPCRKCTNCNCFGHFAKDCKAGPRMVTPVNARNPTTPRGAYFEFGGTDHYKASCPRLNRAPRQEGNRQNQPMAIEGGQGHGNNGNPTRRGAFMMGAEEARQDPNIMTGTFTLKNHYATTLFDSDADYSFVSTTFIHLLDIESSDLGFNYEIKITSGKLVEINKFIRDCKLEIKGHTFDIDLIPFGHESFDVIVGMDWLSWHKAEVVCHEKVVRIPLPHGKILRVLGEKPKEKVRHLMRLPPPREFEFRIDLIPGAMPVSKSPYHLAPSKMEELSSQLRELQDKGFIRPSSSP